VRGAGLKIVADDKHADDTGLYCEDAETGARILADMRDIAQNAPTVISAQTPSDLVPGKSYYIVVCTQSQINGSGRALKQVREVKSEFTVTVPGNEYKEPPILSETVPLSTARCY
jgi:hypothetical protein